MASEQITPAPWCILVQPSQVDDSEEQRESGLIVKREIAAKDATQRGIVLTIGKSIVDDSEYDIAVGHVLIYDTAYRVGNVDLVPWKNTLGWIV